MKVKASIITPDGRGFFVAFKTQETKHEEFGNEQWLVAGFGA